MDAKIRIGLLETRRATFAENVCMLQAQEVRPIMRCTPIVTYYASAGEAMIGVDFERKCPIFGPSAFRTRYRHVGMQGSCPCRGDREGHARLFALECGLSFSPPSPRCIAAKHWPYNCYVFEHYSLLLSNNDTTWALNRASLLELRPVPYTEHYAGMHAVNCKHF
jgi:hypothetical protein